MSQPGRSQIHVNKPLTNISVAFLQRLTGFVADRVFPVVPVQKQSDKYYKYERKQWFRSDAQKRAPSTESAGSGWDLSTDQYLADVWSVHKDRSEEHTSELQS